MNLEDRDRELLAFLGSAPRSVASLTLQDQPQQAVAERLRELVENGLVLERDDGRYERTESGRRVLLTAAARSADRPFDTTPAIEAVLDGYALGPDEADAVRRAYDFVRYWGRVTEAEIVDAIYPEVPAGRDSPIEWWTDLVRGPLAALPNIESPSTAEEPWRYTGRAEVETPDADGRRVLSRTHPVYGDVKHALESLDLDPAAREAARAAFVTLYQRGRVSEADLGGAVYPRHPAGCDTVEDWLDSVVVPVFAALPGVEPADDGVWDYRRP